MFQLIKNYVSKMSKDDIRKFAEKSLDFNIVTGNIGS